LLWWWRADDYDHDYDYFDDYHHDYYDHYNHHDHNHDYHDLMQLSCLALMLLLVAGCNWHDEPLSANGGRRSSWQTPPTTLFDGAN
jgi:hypothetical protein